LNENQGRTRKEAVWTTSKYACCPDIWPKGLSNMYTTATARTDDVLNRIRTGHLLKVTNITTCL